MNSFKIEITSVFDKEKLVSEIWHDDFLIAEINQENEKLKIEIFKNENKLFDLEEFIYIINLAKQELLK